MAEFLVEAYSPGTRQADLAEVTDRMRQAAAALEQDGVDIRYVHSILVPEDETCFHLFEAPSADAVQQAAARAALDFDRIVEAVQRKEPQ